MPSAKPATADIPPTRWPHQGTRSPVALAVRICGNRTPASPTVTKREPPTTRGRNFFPAASTKAWFATRQPIPPTMKRKLVRREEGADTARRVAADGGVATARLRLCRSQTINPASTPSATPMVVAWMGGKGKRGSPVRPSPARPPPQPPSSVADQAGHFSKCTSPSGVTMEG